MAPPKILETVELDDDIFPIKTTYAFIGEYYSTGEPGRCVRMISDYGNIYEGSFLANCRMHGFVISYLGMTNEIKIGWYITDIIHGYYMILDGNTLKVKWRGWFNWDVGIRKFDESTLKDREKWQKFKAEEIFPGAPE